MSAIDLYFDALGPKDVKGRVLRRACRAVVIREDKVLLLYLPGQDVFNLPGGGMEEGETKNACVLRELKEETGYSGKILAQTVIVTEHYQTGSWESTFYLVELTDGVASAQSLTEEEQAVGVELRWVGTLDALDLLETYESKHPHGANIHNREFLGLIHSLQNTPA